MLYAASLRIEDLDEQLKEYTPQIQNFIQHYIQQTGKDLKVFILFPSYVFKFFYFLM